MSCWKRFTGSTEGGFDPTFRLETSWLLSPFILAVLRGLLSLYAFVTLFFIFGWNGTHGMSENSERSFSYFTHLTYWGLAFYFLFSAIHTWTYSRSGIPLLARWPRFLQIAHRMFHSTIVIYPWIVTIVYWALLYENGIFKNKFQIWTNTSQHALNSAFALFEIVFPRTAPLPFVDIIPVIVILAMYLGLAYVTASTQGFWVYGFLDNTTNSSGKVAVYVVGILVAAIVVFLIVRYLIMLRVWVTEKKLGKTGKFASHGGAGYVGDAEKGLPLHNVSGKQ